MEGDVYQYQTLPKAVKDCNVVMCATGSRPALDPLGPFNVDYQGTKNLVVAARQAEVKVRSALAQDAHPIRYIHVCTYQGTTCCMDTSVFD